MADPPPATRRRTSIFLRRLRAELARAFPARRALPLIAAACLSGALDLVAFLLLLGLGVGVMGAQLVSFGLAALCLHGLALRWAGRDGAAPLPPKVDLAARLAIVVVLALALRTGVLASAAALLDLPAPLAFLPALGATAMVSTLGAVFFVVPATLAPLSRAARWRLAALAVVAYSVLLRLMFLGVTELMPQEAYYWNYAQHLDIGYLDHPPMVAWLIFAGTELLGSNEFGVRLAAWLCWGVTAFFSFQLAGRMFGRSAAFITALLVATLPFYFGTGLVMTPDAPLTACWAGTLYFLERALRGGKAGAWGGVGLCFGLGLLSKYTIALLGPAALLFMLLDPRARGWFKRPEPYLAAVVAVLVFSPVILWNLEHDLASFAFQSTRRVSGSFRFSLPELLLGGAGLLTPTVLVAALAVLWLRERGVGGPAPTAGEGGGRQEERRRWLFIGLFTLVPLSVFVGFSLFHMARLNWTGPLWLAVLPAVAAGLLAAPDRLGPRQRHLQRAVAPTLAIALALYGAGLIFLVAGLPGPHVVAPFPAVPVAWQDFGAQAASLAEEVRATTGDEPVLIGLDAYNIASQLAFYAAGAGARPAMSVGRGVLGQPALMYGYWYPPDAYGGRQAVLFAFSRRRIESPLLRFSFAELGEVKQREVKSNGRVVGSFYYRVGRLAAKPALDPAAFAASMAPD
ncbi:glycosyltransferase family 39 protein [Ancylobacter sp. IITR112]|uniref:glycosyltransferase family 39 protein n=1 Tax=Ancylobacter sp. IITR112 TaxID=3138073 RepID=UPI00352B6DD5